MEEPIVSHISDVVAYKSCRRRWAWSSRYHGNLEPKRPYAPFFSGSAVHYCIEEMRSEGIAPLSALSQYLRHQLVELRSNGHLWMAERPNVRQQVRLIRSMVEQYLAWTKQNNGPFADRYMEQIAHECSFGPQIDPGSGEKERGRAKDFPGVLLCDERGEPLRPLVMMAGKFDGLERRISDGTLWISEYKTCRSIEERAKLLPHDEQATLYVYAASNILDEPVSGIIYTLIRKKIPASPEVLLKGTLSTRKNIDTTVAHYRKCIRAHHGKDVTEAFIQKNYGEVLANIAAFADPFVARVAVERTPEQLNNYVRELHATVVEMHDPKTFLYANRTWSCPGCIFRQPCLARDAGDTDREIILLDAEYQPRKAALSELEDADKL